MELLLLALATSAISITIARGGIFQWLRDWIHDHNLWLGKLVACPYCLSHWVAGVLVGIYYPLFDYTWVVVDFILAVFVIVAISAVIIGVITRLIPFQEDGCMAQEEEIHTLREALEKARVTIQNVNKLRG